MSIDIQPYYLLRSTVHDLSGPLGIAVGFSEMLLESDSLTEQDRVYAQAINRAAVRARTTTSGLLRFILDETPFDKAHTEFVPIESAMDEAIHIVRDMFPDKKVRIDVLGTNASLTVKVSNDVIVRILVNLLSNSVKYGVDGAIDVNVQSKGNTVEIDVVNRGPAISEEILFSAFRPSEVFGESNDHRERSGFGLFSSRMLAEISGGTFEIRNVEPDSVKAELILPIHR